MKRRALFQVLGVFIVACVLLAFGSTAVRAHCDTLDGPVIKAAQKALEAGDVKLVLIWVQKKDERDIKKAFEKTVQVRKLGPQAKDLADMYFFETLVRIHRTGEGAPYTGLKPAGLDLGPAVPMADKALESGNVEPLLKFMQVTVSEGLHKSFTKAQSLKNYQKGDVEGGRKYVEAYVPFVHYVERLYGAAEYSAGGNHPELDAASKHSH